MPKLHLKSVRVALMQVLRLTVIAWLWPLVKTRKRPEIRVQTYYPGCTLRITTPGQTWHIRLTNRDPSKISNDRIRDFFGSLLAEHIPQPRLKRGMHIDFCLESVSLENWRDIWSGRIRELIENDEVPQTRKLGAFGYLKGDKLGRLKFAGQARSHPEIFEYIETDKYSPAAMRRSISLLDYKRRFKYVIDPPGHTYSTKYYWMLFLKRPLFYIEQPLKFKWETRLKPWVHYIPVKRDCSNLLKRYQWAEAHPEAASRLAQNLFNFGMQTLPPEAVIEAFLKNVRCCL